MNNRKTLSRHGLLSDGNEHPYGFASGSSICQSMTGESDNEQTQEQGNGNFAICSPVASKLDNEEK